MLTAVAGQVWSEAGRPGALNRMLRTLPERFCYGADTVGYERLTRWRSPAAPLVAHRTAHNLSRRRRVQRHVRPLRAPSRTLSPLRRPPPTGIISLTCDEREKRINSPDLLR